MGDHSAITEPAKSGLHSLCRPTPDVHHLAPAKHVGSGIPAGRAAVYVSGRRLHVQLLDIQRAPLAVSRRTEDASSLNGREEGKSKAVRGKEEHAQTNSQERRQRRHRWRAYVEPT